MFRFFTPKNLALITLFVTSINVMSAQSDIGSNTADKDKSPLFLKAEDSFNHNSSLIAQSNPNMYRFKDFSQLSLSSSKRINKLELSNFLKELSANSNLKSSDLSVSSKRFANLQSAYAYIEYYGQNIQKQPQNRLKNTNLQPLLLVDNEMKDVFKLIKEQSLVITSKKQPGNARYSFYKRFLRIHI